MDECLLQITRELSEGKGRLCISDNVQFEIGLTCQNLEKESALPDDCCADTDSDSERFLDAVLVATCSGEDSN